MSRSDYSLSSSGIPDIVALARNPAFVECKRIISSPSKRAVETAAILVENQPQLGEIAILEDLREMDFGLFEGESRESLEGSPLSGIYQQWMTGGMDAPPPPDGEAWSIAEARADAVLARLMADGTDSAIVTHGYFLRALVVRSLGPWPVQSIRRFTIDNSRLALLEHSPPVGWVCRQFNSR